MNRNKTEEIMPIIEALAEEKKAEEIRNFMTEILTDAELETLSKRWQILEMLVMGKTQREIAESLKVSLCKVTRGSRILKKQNSTVMKYLRKRGNNERNKI